MRSFGDKMSSSHRKPGDIGATYVLVHLLLMRISRATAALRSNRTTVWLTLFVLFVVLPLGCKGPADQLPDRCGDMSSADRAVGAWMYSRGQRDSKGLDRAASCLIEGCKSGVAQSCSNLALLCHNAEDQENEALTKTSACSMPGVMGARDRRGDPVIHGKP
jgi:hypothetical protein